MLELPKVKSDCTKPNTLTHFDAVGLKLDNNLLNYYEVIKMTKQEVAKLYH
jgi:hypothetical protein